ncbi:hypothetical protein [Dysgonomonas macrotermitis]|uniref:Uncharacterized protein n=1 Tax=Dysgonomonas macrotermitis TaxID=1346286 RepID=A0A1M5CFY5_9BACT|nr:hypothetical protein [Dysgonomonas macrotermitis]SHF53648.1 hypothetical protein SAMN05444362_107157 [Dysgonomonas macrotermitis]
MRHFVILLFLISGFNNIYSQIGINIETPHNSAELEINSTNKGVTTPRLTNSQIQAIISPAAGLMIYNTDKKCLYVNLGSESTPEWICMTKNETRFFYMPSINIATPATGTVSTPLDLYAEYIRQFGSPLAKSNSAPSIIPYYSSATDLHYYITYYDKNVLNISHIDDTGKATYSIVRKSDYDTYMNVVFVIK